MPEKIKVAVVDDHRIFREAFASLLKTYQNIEIVGMAENGVKALELLNKVKPDILFLDIEMPEINGEKTAIEVKKKFPDVKIIMLSMYGETFYVKKFFDIGVNSFLSKGCSIHEVIAAINAIQKEGKYYNEDILEKLGFKNHTYLNNDSKSNEQLEKTEIKVLQLVCNGKKGKEIAQMLNITVDVVDYHKKNIKKKTGLNSTPELVKFAIKNGYIPLNQI